MNLLVFEKAAADSSRAEVTADPSWNLPDHCPQHHHAEAWVAIISEINPLLS